MNPFIDALELLRSDGWRQHELGTHGQPRCLVGALTLREEHNLMPRGNFATFLEWLNSDELAIADSIVRAEYSDRLHGEEPANVRLSVFNDHPRTTFADVERVLEKAALAWGESR